MQSSNELASIRTDLAVKRNLMAIERTLMAWVRTSLSLLSFGFTLYKILAAFQQAGGILHEGNTPRNVGLFLTGMGTVAMLMGTIEYGYGIRELRLIQPVRLVRSSFVMALLMSAAGIVLFFSIIRRFV